eukprot:7387207-Prymnesium_polylepis.1
MVVVAPLAVACARAASTRGDWRTRRRLAPSATGPAAAAASASPSPPIADRMHAVRSRVDTALAYPEEYAAPLHGLALDAVLDRRDGLPRTAAALRGGLGAEPLRVCYLGGSVTEQKAGYRPRVTKWLEATGASARVCVEEVPAFCGSARRRFERRERLDREPLLRKPTTALSRPRRQTAAPRCSRS